MLAHRLIDGLYLETMVLADEARSYFDDTGRSARDTLDPLDRVVFSCESLKVTTRLMHVIAWLLTQKAIGAGEMPVEAGRASSRRLGERVISEEGQLARIPDDARVLVSASIALYRRVERLDQGLDSIDPAPSPARSLMNKLQRAF